MPISRRTILHGAALAAAGAALRGAIACPRRRGAADRPADSLHRRAAAGDGIGTSRRYEVAVTPEATAPLREAVERFVALGGTVIDTCAELRHCRDVLGLILDGMRDKIFLATKVAATGARRLRPRPSARSSACRTDKIDLIAVHNLIDTDSNLAILRGLKDKGRIRYVASRSGATTSFRSWKRS